jgi:hypothetical protein
MLALAFLSLSQSLSAKPEDPKRINPRKLKQASEILSALDDPRATVRVLVSLNLPFEYSPKEKRRSIKKHLKLRQRIHNRQMAVLSSLNTTEFRAKHRYRNFPIFSGRITKSGLNKLLDNPMVKSIELVKKQYPLTAQGIPLMNATIPRLTYNGQGVSIAISDTGVDYTHPMLGNGSFPNSKVIGGYDAGGAISGSSSSYDDADSDPFPYGPNTTNGHGTNCAGIAAGDVDAVGDYIGGVAHGAKIYALKITADDDNDAWDDDTIDAWDWCITHKDDDPDNPILIISHSFGAGGYSTAADAESTHSALADAAERVVAADITILAASGNNGYTNLLAAPAAFSSVISVGAVNDISDAVPSYSNTADFLDILAPSEDAYTTDIVGLDGSSDDDYHQSFGGTSAACPYAAGAAACLQSAAKDTTGYYLTPMQIKHVLVSSGDDVTDIKVEITKPRINLEQAIMSIEEPPQASDINTRAEYETPVTIALQAWDEGFPNPPSSLEYVITSLASQGALSEPNGTEITDVPHTLGGNGNEVVYTSRSGCWAPATFSFVADDGGESPDGGASNEGTVTVNIIEFAYTANMDSDPGWTFDDPNWAWGTPTGDGGDDYGNPDPDSGYTDSNVVGYNLGGDYEMDIDPTKWATTPVIDCTGMTNVTLNFYRWLNIEEQPYDYAYIDVSDDGSTWYMIWENESGEIADSSWSLQSYDISAIADDQSTVYVRWGIKSDGGWQYSGWNIDDVELIANNTHVLTGDIKQDCQVDLGDLTIMMDYWLDLCGDCEGADLSDDGKVDLKDFAILAQNWLEEI